MENDISHVAQSTIQLLCAAVFPTSERLRLASRPLDEALQARVQRYIDEHWAEIDLAPFQICRDVGLSRSKLYQLFEHNGGACAKSSVNACSTPTVYCPIFPLLNEWQLQTLARQHGIRKDR